MDTQEYKEGFKSGYFLTKYAPETAKAMLDACQASQSSDKYTNGFAAGYYAYISNQPTELTGEIGSKEESIANEPEIEQIQQRLNYISQNKPAKDDMEMNIER
jgi:hypothetical protein